MGFAWGYILLRKPIILTLTSWLKALSHIMVELGIAIDGGKDGSVVFRRDRRTGGGVGRKTYVVYYIY